MIFLSVCLAIGKHGGGKHQWNVSYTAVQFQWRVRSLPNSSEHILIESNQYSNYEDIVYSIAILSTKLSIFLLILRIFLSVQRSGFWWFTQFLIAVNVIFYTIFFFVPIFLCSPRSKIWTPDQPGHCLKIEDLYIASAVFNMVSDIAMLSVPLYLIWHLKMSVPRKLGVSAIFGTGGL